MFKLDLQEKKLITVLGLYTFANSLAAVFVTAFLFKASDVKTTMLFNLILFSGLLFWYIVSGWALKKVSSAFIMKLSLISGALFYFLMFVLGKRAVEHVVLLGLVGGFSNGNFWAGFNLNQYLLTKKGKRVKYFASLSSLNSFLGALAPLLGGAIVYFSAKRFNINTSYGLLFLFVCLILAASASMIGKLPQHEKILFSFKDLIHHQKTKKWRLILWQQIVAGLYDVSLGAVSIILMFLIVKKEIFLGAAQTANYLLTALGGLLVIRFLPKKRQNYLLGAIGMALGILIFALWQNIFGLIGFIIINGLTAPFLNTWLATIYLNTIDEQEKKWPEKYHLLIEKDFYLGLPRVISFLFLYFFVQFGNQVALAKTWLLVLPIFPLILAWLAKKYDALNP